MSTDPNTYPETMTEATADRMTRHAVTVGIQHANLTSDYISRDDADGRELFVLNIKSIITYYGIAALLRAFREAAPEAADQAARDLWYAWEDGGTPAEFLDEWAQEYGIQIPTEPTGGAA